MVQRGRARDLAEPGARTAAARVEATPLPQGLLEGLGGQVLGGAAIAGQVDEVRMDVVKMPLGNGLEARNLGDDLHIVSTPPPAHRHTDLTAAS